MLKERMLTPKKIRTTAVAWLFMLPALVILAIFVFYPIIYSVPLAFTNYSVFGETKFIWLDNFKRLAADPDFKVAFRNSCIFVIVTPILQLLSVALALLVNRKLPGTPIFRVLIYLPVVTSMVAVGIIWKFIFDANGILNGWLIQLGLIDQPIMFLSDAKLALPTLMAVTIWQGLGYYMMIYLSALQNFPEDLMEAAKLDGASPWTCFWRIRLPLLQPQIWFCSMVSLIAALGVMDIVFTMTSGGPNKSTYVINYYAYLQGFQKFDFGYSAAVGLVLAVVVIIFNIIQNIITKRLGGED